MTKGKAQLLFEHDAPSQKCIYNWVIFREDQHPPLA
jgi:hypothetical protein